MKKTIRVSSKLLNAAKPIYWFFGLIGICIMLGSVYGAFYLIDDPAKGDLGILMFIFPTFGFFFGAMFAHKGFYMATMNPKDFSLEIEDSTSFKKKK